jgi:hypothetical protein
MQQLGRRQSSISSLQIKQHDNPSKELGPIDSQDKVEQPSNQETEPKRTQGQHAIQTQQQSPIPCQVNVQQHTSIVQLQAHGVQAFTGMEPESQPSQPSADHHVFQQQIELQKHSEFTR